MIYDPAPAFTPPALHAPEAMPVKKRRGRGTRRGVTGLVVGMIILDGDGQPCRIVGFDRTGTPWCTPVNR
jgi:hypothetical protein